MSTAILAPGSRGRRLSKRLMQVVITLFGLLLLTFTIGRVMPIDPVLAIVGPDADQSTYQQVYQQQKHITADIIQQVYIFVLVWQEVLVLEHLVRLMPLRMLQHKLWQPQKQDLAFTHLHENFMR